MNTTPENLLYTKEHEWIKVEGDHATIGITDFAQNALGDIVFVELPEIGENYTANDTFGVVESIKSVSDLFIPVSGEVVERNDSLEDTPELCNQSAYDQAWMIKVKMSDLSEKDGLMSAAQYSEFCASQQ
jgi:glycine cleavage system H protein